MALSLSLSLCVCVCVCVFCSGIDLDKEISDESRGRFFYTNKESRLMDIVSKVLTSRTKETLCYVECTEWFPSRL